MKLTEIPRLLQALGGVDIGEGFLELLVMNAREAVLVEVVAGGDDKIGGQLLADHSHLLTRTHFGQ